MDSDVPILCCQILEHIKLLASRTDLEIMFEGLRSKFCSELEARDKILQYKIDKLTNQLSTLPYLEPVTINSSERLTRHRLSVGCLGLSVKYARACQLLCRGEGGLGLILYHYFILSFNALKKIF